MEIVHNSRQLPLTGGALSKSSSHALLFDEVPRLSERRAYQSILPNLLFGVRSQRLFDLLSLGFEILGGQETGCPDCGIAGALGKFSIPRCEFAKLKRIRRHYFLPPNFFRIPVE